MENESLSALVEPIQQVHRKESALKNDSFTIQGVAISSVDETILFPECKRRFIKCTK